METRNGTQAEYAAMPSDTKARIAHWLANIGPECRVIVNPKLMLLFTKESLPLKMED